MEKKKQARSKLFIIKIVFVMLLCVVSPVTVKATTFVTVEVNFYDEESKREYYKGPVTSKYESATNELMFRYGTTNDFFRLKENVRPCLYIGVGDYVYPYVSDDVPYVFWNPYYSLTQGLRQGLVYGDSFEKKWLKDLMIPIFSNSEAAKYYVETGKVKDKNDIDTLPPGFIVDEDGNIGEVANNQLNPVNDNKSIPTPKNLSMTREKFQDVYSKAEYIQDYQLNFILKKTKLADYLTGDYSDTKQGSTVSRTTWKSATDFVDNADITTFSLHLCADIEYSYKKDGATITKKTGYVWYGDDIMTTKQALTLSNEDMKQYIQGIQTGATLKNIYYYYVGYVPEKNTYAKGNSVKIALQDSPWDAEARPPVEYEEEDPDGESVDGEYTDKVTDGKTGEDGVVSTPRPNYKPGIVETVNGTKSLLDNIGQLPQLLAHLFTFIPKEIWTIFIIGISFLVGVGILKIVF